MPKLNTFVFSVLICVLLSAPAGFSGSIQFELQEKSFEELNALEFTANSARSFYWEGDHSQALNAFQSLSLENHASLPLYWNEMAMCHLALGDHNQARENLFMSCSFSDTYFDAKREKKALSKFGQEGQKVYLGDPYERAFQYLFLALLFMDEGDYDNALAACKSGLLADSDSVENLYESDLTLLHLLEAKCHLLRGDQDMAAAAFEQARKSYRTTSLEARHLFEARTDELTKFKAFQNEKKKVRQKILPKIREKIQELNQSLASFPIQNPAEDQLGLLMSGQYNTLILIPKGQSPKKIRAGTNANEIRFQAQGNDACLTELYLDGVKMSDSAINDVADVEFQATTTGGRCMDSVLRKQAKTREKTQKVGNTLTDVGNQVGGLAGLGAVLVGVTFQTVAGAINPEADTRCWQTLPCDFDVYAYNLPRGGHEVNFSQYVYFEKINSKRSFHINSDQDMAVVIAPPSVTGRYCTAGFKVRKRSPDSVVLVAPPLGFSQIEIFTCPYSKEKPQAFAPDVRKIARMLSRAFRKKGLTSSVVGHDDIINDRQKAVGDAEYAVQISPGDFHFKKDKRSLNYSSSFSFTLVDLNSGIPRVKTMIEGSWLKTKKDKKKGCTDAFYECFKQAVQDFMDNEQVQQALSLSSAA